jgi:hypothetical protein
MVTIRTDGFVGRSTVRGTVRGRVRGNFPWASSEERRGPRRDLNIKDAMELNQSPDLVIAPNALSRVCPMSQTLWDILGRGICLVLIELC